MVPFKEKESFLACQLREIFEKAGSPSCIESYANDSLENIDATST